MWEIDVWGDRYLAGEVDAGIYQRGPSGAPEIVRVEE